MKLNIVTTLLLLIFSCASFASKSDFLKKIEKGEGLTQSSMLDGFPANVVSMVSNDYKKKFPNFKENMLFVFQWDDGSEIHFVSYHFDVGSCVYSKIVKSQVGKSGLPSSLTESVNESRGVRLAKDSNQEKIDIKYCKMLYSF